MSPLSECPPYQGPKSLGELLVNDCPRGNFCAYNSKQGGGSAIALRKIIMKNDVSLPEHLGYVAPLARKYAVHQPWVDRYNAMIDRLTKDQLNEIAGLYERIADSNHAKELASWVSGFWISEAQPPRLVQQVFELFGIFELLADRGVAPFSSWKVEFIQPLPRLDWRKLPNELSYLIEPAEKYGIYNTKKQRPGPQHA